MGDLHLCFVEMTCHWVSGSNACCDGRLGCVGQIYQLHLSPRVYRLHTHSISASVANMKNVIRHRFHTLDFLEPLKE